MATKGRQWFIVIVIIVIIIAAVGYVIFHKKNPESTTTPYVKLNASKYPTTGDASAPNQIVAFEDLKCVACMMYNTTLYPKVAKELIATGRVKYSVALVAFIPGSSPAGNTALCLNDQSNKDFFTFVHYVYDHQPPEEQNWATIAMLLQMVQKSVPNANMTTLTNCMTTGKYLSQLEKNLKSLEGAMQDKGIATPSIFVNGHLVRPLTMKNIKKYLH